LEKIKFENFNISENNIISVELAKVLIKVFPKYSIRVFIFLEEKKSL
jgi:hypothetical protein